MRPLIAVAGTLAAGAVFAIVAASSGAGPSPYEQAQALAKRAATVASEAAAVRAEADELAAQLKPATTTTETTPPPPPKTATSFNVTASNTTIDGYTIKGATGACITVQPGLTNVTIRNTHVEGCGGDGIRFVKGSGAYSGGTISNVTIKGVGTSNHEANDMTLYADNLLVEHVDMSGAPNDAVDLWGANQTYRYVTIHDLSNPYGNHNDAWQSWTGGVGGGGEGRAPTNLVIERSTVNNVTGSNSHIMVMEGPGYQGWTIRSNVFSNVGSAGLILGKTASESGSNQASNMSNIVVSNNTFYKTGDASSAVKFNSATGSGVVADNIFYGSGFYKGGGASVTRGFNNFWGANGASASTDTASNPLLANPAGGDFHETASSPTVNTGDNGTLVPIRPADRDGVPPIGVVDRGAYER